jgi:hypothetical protein
MKTHFKLFINHGNHDDSFVEVIIHICMVFGYDLLCDLLEMLNSIYFLCIIFFRRIFQYYPLSFLQLMFLSSKID